MRFPSTFSASKSTGPPGPCHVDLTHEAVRLIFRKVGGADAEASRAARHAARESVPDAVAVGDPFNVVCLSRDALDNCRRHVQPQTHGHHGRTGDPLYDARRTLHTGLRFLAKRQGARLDALFADERPAMVEVARAFYQRLVPAYREPESARGKQLMQELVDAIGSGIPKALHESGKLGRTLKRRAVDVLAYLGRPGTPNGPTEAINGRREHLRGSALGLRNLSNDIAQSLFEAGTFRPLLHAQVR